jgi:Zn-dependent protease with chaperone function
MKRAQLVSLIDKGSAKQQEADQRGRVAQSYYNHPFKLFVVHQPNPNAFATPGGNVYVVDSLFYFVKNTEQFAGTLCHEVSHTIHPDALERLKQEQKIQLREIGAALLLGPSISEMLAIAIRLPASASALIVIRSSSQLSASGSSAWDQPTADRSRYSRVLGAREYPRAPSSQKPSMRLSR